MDLATQEEMRELLRAYSKLLASVVDYSFILIYICLHFHNLYLYHQERGPV